MLMFMRAKAVQRTGANRFARRQIAHHRRLAPVADLVYRSMELLALALILSATSCSRTGGDCTEMRIETQIAIFETALGAFDVDTGRFPSTAEGLLPLIVRPNDVNEQQWHGPYLKVDQIPKDRWGHDYVYRYPGIHNTNGCDIYSLGPDGKSRTEGNDPDDVRNWR